MEQKPALSVVLSSLVQFQSVPAELQLTVLAFVGALSFVLPHLFLARAHGIRSASAAGLVHDAV